MWVCKPTTYLLTEHNKIEVEKNEDKKGGIFYILVIYCGREIGEKIYISLSTECKIVLPVPGTSECRTFPGNVGSLVYQAWIHISRSYRHVTASIDAPRRSSMYTFHNPSTLFCQYQQTRNQPTCRPFHRNKKNCYRKICVNLQRLLKVLLRPPDLGWEFLSLTYYRFVEGLHLRQSSSSLPLDCSAQRSSP